jgi:hypothetical protein
VHHRPAIPQGHTKALNRAALLISDPWKRPLGHFFGVLPHLDDLQVVHTPELNDPKVDHFDESTNRSFPENRKSRNRPLIRLQIKDKFRPIHHRTPTTET